MLFNISYFGYKINYENNITTLTTVTSNVGTVLCQENHYLMERVILQAKSTYLTYVPSALSRLIWLLKQSFSLLSAALWFWMVSMLLIAFCCSLKRHSSSPASSSSLFWRMLKVIYSYIGYTLLLASRVKNLIFVHNLTK